jgi:hypothetical protein
MGYAVTIPQSSLEFGTNLMGGSVLLTTIATVTSIPDFNGIPTALGKIKYAYLDILFPHWENTSGAGTNYVNGDQYIQVQKKSGGAWINAFYLNDTCLEVNASATNTYGWLLGNIDIGAYVYTGGFNCRWHDAAVLRDNIRIQGMQMRIRCIMEG